MKVHRHLLSLAVLAPCFVMAATSPAQPPSSTPAAPSGSDDLGEYTAALASKSDIPAAPPKQTVVTGSLANTPARPTPSPSAKVASDALQAPVVAQQPAPVAPAPVVLDKPAALKPDTTVATGMSILPARPVAATMTFGNVTAGEAILRFATEYNTAIVLIGDANLKVNGTIQRTDDLVGMLRAVFTPPIWTVTPKEGSVVVASADGLTLRHIDLSKLNPPATESAPK